MGKRIIMTIEKKKNNNNNDTYNYRSAGLNRFIGFFLCIWIHIHLKGKIDRSLLLVQFLEAIPTYYIGVRSEGNGPKCEEKITLRK